MALLCRLQDSSGEEAVQAGELATSLGVRHHVLTVDWEGAVPAQYKIQYAAREKRYEALLKYCRRTAINNIMFGHHLDDQIGEYLQITSKWAVASCVISLPLPSLPSFSAFPPFLQSLFLSTCLPFLSTVPRNHGVQVEHGQ